MSEAASNASESVTTTQGSESLLDVILYQTRIQPSDEGYESAKIGIGAFISALLKPEAAGEKVNSAVVDAMVAEIDRKLSAQVNAILHDPVFQKLESAWKGVKYQVDHTDFRQNILLRLPYSVVNNPVQRFQFNENASEDSGNYLWGNTAFALGSRITASFANYRWCPNIIGPQSGGTVEDLPLHSFEAFGQNQTKIPTEMLISDRREFELAEMGFISLTMRKDSDNAAFFSANSVQKPKFFGNTPEGKQAELNYRLGTELPYLFIVSRLAHYIKVLQRENIGSWKSRTELQTELANWIKQYISDQENPSADVRSRRPLRRAQITVEDVEGEAGWYRVRMSIQPHFKYMGADFTLSLVGRLDKD